MFNKYFLETITRNMSDGVAQEIKAYDSEREARDKFYDKLSSLGGSAQTKYARIELKNSDGNLVKLEVIDNAKYIVPEIPEPQPEVPVEE